MCENTTKNDLFYAFFNKFNNQLIKTTASINTQLVKNAAISFSCIKYILVNQLRKLQFQKLQLILSKL